MSYVRLRSLRFLSCTHLYIAAIFLVAIGCVSVSENDAVAEICGHIVKRSDFEIPLEVKMDKKAVLTKLEYQRWLQREQMAQLIEKLMDPLLCYYSEKQNILVSRDEISSATNYFERVSQKEKTIIKAKRASIDNEIQTGTFSTEEREKLEMQKWVQDQALNIIEFEESSEATNRMAFASWFVKRQKTNDALYREFGGDVIVCEPLSFIKEGIEPRYYPLDAYRQLIERALRDRILIYKNADFMKRRIQQVFSKDQYLVLSKDQADGVFLKWMTINYEIPELGVGSKVH